MTLKEQMIKDMENVFFGLDEGSVEIIFNGAPVTVNPAVSKKTYSGFENSPEQGVLEERRTYFFKGTDLEVPPVPWEEVDINGTDWTVLEVYPVYGTLKITFFRESS